MTGDAARKPPYSSEQREEALRLYREIGSANASRECGVPAATIRSWAHRDGIATTVPPSEQTRAATDAARLSRAQRRLKLAEEAGAVAVELLERIGGTRKATDVRALATGFGELVAKAQLLDGGPSERVEVSEGERRERVAKLRDEIAARRQAKTGGSTTYSSPMTRLPSSARRNSRTTWRCSPPS